MGLTCKPVGKMKRIMVKLSNELQREKEAIKVKEKKSTKE